MAVGNGITVGSSIGAGDLAGVAVTAGVAIMVGVGAPSGNSKRPRLCEIAGEAAVGAIGFPVALGNSVCDRDVAISPTIRADNAKHFRMRPGRLVV